MTWCLRWPLPIPGARPFQTGISSNGNKSKSTVDVRCVPAMLCYPLSMSPQCKDSWTSNTKYQGAALLFIHSALSSHAKLFFPTQLPAILSIPINGEEETTSLYMTSIHFLSQYDQACFSGNHPPYLVGYLFKFSYPFHY